MNGGSGWEIASESQSSSIHKNNGVRRLAERSIGLAGGETVSVDGRRAGSSVRSRRRTDGDVGSGDRSECTVPQIVVSLTVEPCLAGDD